MSILKQLAEDRILSVERFGSSSLHADEALFPFRPERGEEFIISEACDGYFYRLLTRDELRELARELNALADA